MILKEVPVRSERFHYRSMATKITFHVKMRGVYDHEVMLQAVRKIQEVHPILSFNVEDKNGQVYYTNKNSPQPVVKIYSEDTGQLIEKESVRFMAIDKEWMIKIFVKKYKDYFSLVLIAHHMVGDARSILLLLDDLLILYGGGSVHEVEEPAIISTADQLPGDSGLSPRQKYYVDYLNKKWEKEKQVFDKDEFRKIYENYYASHRVRHASYTLKEEEAERVLNLCRQHKVTLTSSIIVALFKAAHKVLPKCIDKYIQVNLPVSIRHELDFLPRQCVGNYCTGIDFKYVKKEEGDFWEETVELHKKMTDKLNRNTEKYLVLNMLMGVEGTLLDALPFTVCGEFDSLVARQTADLFGFHDYQVIFDVSNIGAAAINKVKGLHELIDIEYIPPLELPDRITLGVIGFEHKINLSMTYDAAKISESQISKIFDYMLDMYT